MREVSKSTPPRHRFKALLSLPFAFLSASPMTAQKDWRKLRSATPRPAAQDDLPASLRSTSSLTMDLAMTTWRSCKRSATNFSGSDAFTMNLSGHSNRAPILDLAP